MPQALCAFLKRCASAVLSKNSHLPSSTGALRAGAGDPTTGNHPFHPRVRMEGKLYAYWITVNYRRPRHVCLQWTLFNHESPRRGETFVTRKITRGLARIDAGLEDCLFMGTLMTVTGAMPATTWKCNGECCSKNNRDFVIATGRQESVRRFIELSASALGWGMLQWDGEGLEEVGRRRIPVL